MARIMSNGSHYEEWFKTIYMQSVTRSVTRHQYMQSVTRPHRDHIATTSLKKYSRHHYLPPRNRNTTCNALSSSISHSAIAISSSNRLPLHTSSCSSGPIPVIRHIISFTTRTSSNDPTSTLRVLPVTNLKNNFIPPFSVRVIFIPSNTIFNSLLFIITYNSIQFFILFILSPLYIISLLWPHVITTRSTIYHSPYHMVTCHRNNISFTFLLLLQKNKPVIYYW